MKDASPIFEIKWEEIIKAAAASSLGICALAILAVAALAAWLFKNAPPKVRLRAFALVVLFVVIGLAFTLEFAKQKVVQQKSEVMSAEGRPIPEVPEKLRTALPETVPQVIRRLTETDLTTLRETGTNAPPSIVFNKHTFTLKKTSASQTKFYHIASTSSETAPVLNSDTHNFTIEESGLSKDGKLHEFLFVFDVSKDPVGQEFDLRYVLKFTGAFDRPDQQWAGIRIAQPTELAIFRVRFPTNRPALSPEFYVKETVSELRIDLLAETLRIEKIPAENAPGYRQVDWQIPRPKTDQRYCIAWQW